MLQFTYPGVYTDEVSSGVRSITGAATSVALFIGPTRGGIDDRPTRIRNFGDFERSFGGLSQTSNLSYSVLHFFANGGGEAYVHRLGAGGALKAASAFKQSDADATSMIVTALSSGVAGNDLFVEFDQFDLGAPADTKRFNLTVRDRITGRVERFGNLTTAADNARFAETVVNAVAGGSQLVNVTVVAAGRGKAAPLRNGTVMTVALPAAGAFAKEARIAITVRGRDANGKLADAVAKRQVAVFSKGDAIPGGARVLAARLERAINADLAAFALGGGQRYVVEAGAFDDGKRIRVRVSPAMVDIDQTRLSDAVILVEDTTAAPAGADFTNTLGDLGLTAEGAATAARFRLGALYLAANGSNENANIEGTTKVRAGSDGNVSGQPATDAFKHAVQDLADRDPFFNVLCLPDLVRPSAADPNAPFHTGVEQIYDLAADVCRRKFAFLLVDPTPDVIDLPTAEHFKSTRLVLQDGKHAAAFFPNIRVDDPLEPGAIRSHPPSGAIAGVIARTDGQFGVWQAPAGTEALLAGVYGPSIVLSDEDQGTLNVLGLNCIRQFPIYGTVNFGSRTVDGANALDSEWKYIPVRRTASYILRSLSEALRWAVHKPNGEQLWAELRLNVTAFMHGLFRQGAFKGTAAKDAYFVRCDASTTTATDIDQGIVNIQIGFAPLKPAEFVVITLRQIVQAQA